MSSQETIERLKEQAAAEAEETEEEAEEEAVDPEPAEKKDSKREYIVLQQGGGKGDWSEVTRVVAGGAGQAIESLGEKLKNNATYVATPARNWHEKTVEIETTTSVKLK